MKRTGALLLLLVGLTARADEAELQGFITNNTISRSGHEFYLRFCERLNDISGLDFNLAIRRGPRPAGAFWSGSSTRTKRCTDAFCSPMWRT